MKVTDIAFACYPVTDLRRARRFYEGVLGLKESRFFGEGDKGFVEYDLGSNTLGIGNGAPDWKPSPGGGSVGLEVEDFNAAISRVSSNTSARSGLNRWKHPPATWRSSPIRTGIPSLSIDGNVDERASATWRAPS
jgi:catechol 2,3-dioxygenase-like lactoylglutathione lyase family enzyme